MDMHSGRYYRAAVGSYSGFIDPAYENSSYVSASELAGQKSGSVSEKLEENRNEDLAESSESKMASQMVNRIRKMVLVQKRMRTVEIAALDRTRMKKLPK